VTMNAVTRRLRTLTLRCAPRTDRMQSYAHLVLRADTAFAERVICEAFDQKVTANRPDRGREPK